MLIIHICKYYIAYHVYCYFDPVQRNENGMLVVQITICQRIPYILTSLTWMVLNFIIYGNIIELVYYKSGKVFLIASVYTDNLTAPLAVTRKQ